jgi:hypothetical protein
LLLCFSYFTYNSILKGCFGNGVWRSFLSLEIQTKLKKEIGFWKEILVG